MPGHFPAWKQMQLGGIVEQKERGNVGEKWDMKVHHRIHNSQPLTSFLSQMRSDRRIFSVG
jgi:hypothetical protein